MCNFAFHSIKFEHLLQIVANCMNKGVRKGGFGVNNIPLYFDMLQKLYYLRKRY